MNLLEVKKSKHSTKFSFLVILMNFFIQIVYESYNLFSNLETLGGVIKKKKRFVWSLVSSKLKENVGKSW